jgi:ATP-binding cassette subfamily C protein LapB
MGVDMPIGEQGKGLSGGQKQSVAIARAVVNQPAIFLFDELSAAMDNQTEQEVIQNIKELTKDKTLILSTHRSSLLTLVDRIVVMDAGKIVADGPKEKVMDALKRGLIRMSGSEEKK